MLSWKIRFGELGITQIMNHWLIKLSVNEFICPKNKSFPQPTGRWPDEKAICISEQFEFPCQAVNLYSLQISVRNRSRLQLCTFVTVKLVNTFPILTKESLWITSNMPKWKFVIHKHEFGVFRIQIHWFILSGKYQYTSVRLLRNVIPSSTEVWFFILLLCLRLPYKVCIFWLVCHRVQ